MHYKKNTEDPEYTDQLIKTMETIMSGKYFRFHNKIYKQEDEILIGSPASSILSEIFLQ